MWKLEGFLTFLIFLIVAAAADVVVVVALTVFKKCLIVVMKRFAVALAFEIQGLTNHANRTTTLWQRNTNFILSPFNLASVSFCPCLGRLIKQKLQKLRHNSFISFLESQS